MTKKTGFSLVEVLIALVIVAIMVALVGLNLGGAADEARVVQTQAQIQTLSEAVRLFHAQQGFYPTQQQGLEALVREPTTPPRPPRFPEAGYLGRRTLPEDAWGRPFIYLRPGRDGEPFEILSYGADGMEGGEGVNANISSSD